MLIIFIILLLLVIIIIIIVTLLVIRLTFTKSKTKLRGLYTASELYRPGERRLSAKLVPNFADRGCRVVSATDLPGR
jgi:hypothetical protein